MANSTQQDAEAILYYLASIPFEECIALSKEFRELPMTAGLYAVRHRTQGILYIGKTRALRDRFRNGHKALLWAFIEALQVADVRLIFYTLGFDQWLRLSADLEALIIQAINPPYNVRIPARD